jgi:hypothetical protein
MDSPHDVLCASLLETLGGLSNPSVPDQLLRWARDESLAPEARATAVRQLARQPRNRVGNARALAEMLDEEDFRLRRAVVEAIAQMSDPASRSALRAYYPRARTADERRAIEAVLSGTW